MTSYWLDEWLWAMFEPTLTWPNFTFGQLFMWIGANNDQIWLPNPVLCVLPVPIPESLVSVDRPLSLLPVPHLASTTWVPVTRPVRLGDPRSLVPQYGPGCYTLLPGPRQRTAMSGVGSVSVSQPGKCLSELWCAGIGNPKAKRSGVSVTGCIPVLGRSRVRRTGYS